jgi:hypothetical protein
MLGTGEPQQPVVGVADIAQSPVVRIIRVLARQVTTLQDQLPRRVPLVVPFGLLDRILQDLISPVGPAAAAEVVLGQQPLFDKLIEPIKVDVRQDR